MPTQAEVDEHNMTHLPYRSWCTHCVRGRGEAHPHHKSGNEDPDVPELHVDCCFMGKSEEKAQPILVVKKRDTRMMCSMLVGEKGMGDEHVIKRIIAFIEELGYELGKIVLKSDQESSVKSVIDAVIRARRDAPTMPEYSPVRSSGSNGVIERGIKEVQGQLSAMKSALDTRVRVDIRGTSNILPWMVEYASVLLVVKDGKTAYERLRGKKSKMLGFEFGESVHFRRIPLQGRLGKLDSLWQTGLFVGYWTQSGEYMVANSEGAVKTTMKRIAEHERWNQSEIEGMPWTPWKFKTSSGTGSPGEADRAGLGSFLDIEIDKPISMPAPLRVEEDAMLRRVYTSRGRCLTSMAQRTAVWDAPTVPLAEREFPIQRSAAAESKGDEK